MNYELLGILLTVVMQAFYFAHKMGKFEEKLNVIEKKQDKHNDVITRTYKIEGDVRMLQEQVKYENDRIKGIEDRKQ